MSARFLLYVEFFGSHQQDFDITQGVPMEDEERGKGNILRDAFAPVCHERLSSLTQAPTYKTYKQLLVAILNFPFPTICSINGKCEGGACVIAMSHDYRILDSDQGSISFDAIHLGAHFIGICSVMREKLNHQSAKMMCLEGHIFTPNEALKHDIADGLAKQNALERLSETLARRVAIFGKHGAYGLMRREIMSDSIAKIMMNCQ